MQAIILAGGMGTRLRPLTYTIPKPMLPVAGRPALAHIIDALTKVDCREVIVTTNYLAEFVSGGLHTLDAPIPVRCVQEDKPLGTAGCIKNVIDELDDEFLVIQGDAVAEMDYQEFIDFHHAKDADVSIAVMRVQDTREFGVVALDEEHRIQRFQEKPRPEEAFSHLANSGFYLVKKHVFDDVPADQTYDFSRQLFPRLLAEGARFYAWDMRGYWVDIGRINQYLEANQHLIRGHADIAPDVVVPETAKLVPPFVIGAGTRLVDGCVIGPGTIIGSRCTVGAGAQITGSVLYNDVVIGAGSRLSDCVVASSSRLGERVSVEPMAVIGERCSIGSDAQIFAHSRVGPVTPVAAGTVVDGAVSPRLETLEGLQRNMAHATTYQNLEPEPLVICALLALFGESSARTLAETAQIPFSRIHTALAQLEEQGLVLSTLDVPKRYALTRDEPRPAR